MRDDDLALAGALATVIHGAAISLSLIDGSTITGTIVRAGRSAVVLASDDRRWIVALPAITLVRHLGPIGVSDSNFEEIELPVLLESTLEFGDEVHVRVIAQTITGSMHGIGSDVLVLRANDGSVVHVAIERIVAVAFAASDEPAMRHEARNDSTSDRMSRITRPNR